MKVTKPFCIDGELLEKLKKCNASELANRLLLEYFDGKEDRDLFKLQARLKQNEAKKKEISRQIRDIKAKIVKEKAYQDALLRQTKTFSKRVLQEIEGCDTQSNLWASYRTSDAMKKHSWTEIRKLFFNLKGGTS